ncbi:MAG: hypothetical protein FJY18_00795 [Bacteroidetes bacterium]|nr:hypothetical protein [Bacteroidota bacterium]
MNRNRRRSEHPAHGGFWSTLLGRKQEGRPAIDDCPEEFEPSTETRSGAGHRPSTETRSGLGHWQWEDVSRHIPFILYCTFLLLVYIANGHSQESKQRKILSTRQEVEDLKAEYILLQSEVMHLGRRTEVLDRLQNMGMGWKSPQEPPVELESKNEGTSPKRKGT